MVKVGIEHRELVRGDICRRYREIGKARHPGCLRTRREEACTSYVVRGGAKTGVAGVHARGGNVLFSVLFCPLPGFTQIVHEG